MNKKQKQIVFLLAALVMVVAVANLIPLTVISLSKLYIEPQGYEDPSTHEWRGSFWSVEMLVDVDDQIAAFHLENDDDTDPTETYVQAGNWGGVTEKVYVEDFEVAGNQLIPTSNVMIHVTPQQPYYERELEIQQGYYAPKTYGGYKGKFVPNYGKLDDTFVEQKSFQHYSFGSGSWTLHTPFEVIVYKNGIEIGRQTIDTVGQTGTYRIPASGSEYISITDLGKIGTGYGEPQWDDIIYFSNSYIFVGTPSVRDLIRYDAGEIPYNDGHALLSVQNYDAYSIYWYGYRRWKDDYSPGPLYEATYPGWTKDEDSINYLRYPIELPIFPGDKPLNRQQYMSLVEWLEWKGVPKASKPSWLQQIKKTDDNKLRLYLPYGSASSWVTIRISTELADTVVWQPQAANFKIVDFPDFGDIADDLYSSITVECVEGAGSGALGFYKDPSNIPLMVAPMFGLPRMVAGEKHRIDFHMVNLGIDQDTSFSVTAKAVNSLGITTDTATAYGKLLKKTGASTVLHVITKFDDKPVSGVPVVVEYAQESKSAVTDSQGAGLATFSLESYGGSVSVRFDGNAIYLPITKTANVQSGSETTVTLNLQKQPLPPTIDYTWLLIALGVGGAAVIGFVYLKKQRRL